MEKSNKDIECPECGTPMELTWSEWHRYKNGEMRPFYRCINHHEGCDVKHWAHPDGTPMGFPVGKRARMARHALHEALLIKYPHPTKKHRLKCHFWLQAKGFPAHVGQMDLDQCMSALKILEDEDAIHISTDLSTSPDGTKGL